MTAVIKQVSFRDYIKKELSSADSSLSCELTDYLADLLCFYLRSDRFYPSCGPPDSGCEETLVSLYGKIHSAKARREKIYLFKKMGDLSLYVSGFFRSAVEKKTVSVSYYENMGQSAYSYIADCYGSQKNVFSSLSYRFRNLAESLFYIQKKSELRDNKRSVALYREYITGKKPAVLKRLLREGRFPTN